MKWVLTSPSAISHHGLYLLLSKDGLLLCGTYWHVSWHCLDCSSSWLPGPHGELHAHLCEEQLMTCYQWLDQDNLFPSCLTAEECTLDSHLTEVWSIFVIMFKSLKMLTAQFYCLKDCLSIFSQSVKISHTDLHITCSGKDGSVTSRMTLPTSHMLLSSQWLWAI